MREFLPHGQLPGPAASALFWRCLESPGHPRHPLTLHPLTFGRGRERWFQAPPCPGLGESCNSPEDISMAFVHRDEEVCGKCKGRSSNSRRTGGSREGPFLKNIPFSQFPVLVVINGVLLARGVVVGQNKSQSTTNLLSHKGGAIQTSHATGRYCRRKEVANLWILNRVYVETHWARGGPLSKNTPIYHLYCNALQYRYLGVSLNR